MRKIKIPDNPIAFCQEGTQLVREHGYIWINSTQDVHTKIDVPKENAAPTDNSTDPEAMGFPE